MRIKTSKADIAFSYLVRARDKGVCRHCGETTRLMDCAHIESRSHVGTRWHPRNAVTLTRKCHMYFTQNPFDWRDWCYAEFGDDYMDELRAVAHTPTKWTAAERRKLVAWLLGKYRVVRSRREGGDYGDFDFEPHPLLPELTSPVLPRSG